MILRGPQLSERRLVLPLTSVAAPERSLAEVKQSSTVNASKVEAPPNPKPQVIAPENKESALTFESVVAWLAVQDEKTRNSCASILATEMTKIYETAKVDGFELGRQAGEVAARKECEKQIELLQKISEGTQFAFEHEQKQLRDICVEVIGEALAKICGPLLSSKQAAIGAVQQVLTRVKEGRELTIRVSRDDYDLVCKLEKELSGALNGRKYEIVPDSRVELGGCLVETKLGSLDGRLEVQLRELYETLRLAKLSMPELP